jgi:hypothetical protein
MCDELFLPMACGLRVLWILPARRLPRSSSTHPLAAPRWGRRPREQERAGQPSTGSWRAGRVGLLARLSAGPVSAGAPAPAQPSSFHTCPALSPPAAFESALWAETGHWASQGAVAFPGETLSLSVFMAQ